MAIGHQRGIARIEAYSFSGIIVPSIVTIARLIVPLLSVFSLSDFSGNSCLNVPLLLFTKVFSVPFVTAPSTCYRFFQALSCMKFAAISALWVSLGSVRSWWSRISVIKSSLLVLVISWVMGTRFYPCFLQGSVCSCPFHS